MAIGLAQLKAEWKSSGLPFTTQGQLHDFLDRFYLSRIGIRILIGQHIALHEPQREDHIGAPFTMFSCVLQNAIRQIAIVFEAILGGFCGNALTCSLHDLHLHEEVWAPL
jgi:hypothetical protein